MDWVEAIKIISPIVMLLISTLLSILAYFAKRTIDGLAAQISASSAEFRQQAAAARDDHEDLEKEFLKFQAVLPRMYVLKDDHIRHITIVEKKIDDHAAMTHSALSSLAGDIKLLLRESPKRKNDEA